LVDYEMGGIAIQNPSQGYFVSQWFGRVIGETTKEFQLRKDGEDWVTFFTRTGNVTEVAFTFDLNMNTCFAFVEDNVPYMRWFDPAVNQYVIFEFPDNCRSPRLCLDEKRQPLSSNADIILMYIRDDMVA